MLDKYIKSAEVFKALGDVKRIMIIDMLSCNEMCACNILAKFDMSQSTLSHHMKILCACNLVNAREEGKWIYYSLNNEGLNRIEAFFMDITSNKNDCICRKQFFGDRKCDKNE